MDSFSNEQFYRNTLPNGIGCNAQGLAVIWLAYHFMLSDWCSYLVASTQENSFKSSGKMKLIVVHKMNRIIDAG